MHVLLVESDRDLADSLARSLRRHASAVHVVHDGVAALYHAGMIYHNAIVLDETLTDRGGFEVLWEMRRRGVDARVIMLVEPEALERRLTALSFGADGYVTKPVDAERVIERLDTLVRRRKRGKRLTVRDLRIDTRGQRVWRGGKSVDLTAEEYLLLELLALNAGHVVDADEISERLGGDTLATVRGVQAYIERLRLKLERPGAAPLIQVLDDRSYGLDVKPAV